MCCAFWLITVGSMRVPQYVHVALMFSRLTGNAYQSLKFKITIEDSY